MTGRSPAEARPADDPLTERSTRVVALAKLHRSAQRRDQGRFLVEGANSVAAAVRTGRARTVFVRDEPPVAATITALIDEARAAGVEVVAITARAADKVAETATTAGVFALSALLDVAVDDVVSAPSDDPLVIAVDLSEPGNAGTIIRTADALGSAGVVLAGDAVDPHNGKCVRASAGSVFHVPIARDPDVLGVVDRARASGRLVLATDGEGAMAPGDLAARGVFGRRVAWVFGNEAHGLPDGVLAAADHRVAIPIRGGAESLNVAAAAAICLYASG